MVPTSVSFATHHRVHLLNVSAVRTDEKHQKQNTRGTFTPTKLSSSSHNTTINTRKTIVSPTQPSETKKTSANATSARGEAKRRTNLSVLELIFKAFDDIINFIDPPSRPSVDPRHVLSQNFAPVDELPPTVCEVIEGSLPPCLDGAYIRNGPNPQFFPKGPYHLFDGDGMLHCIRMSQGKATLCSRYVRTYKYNIENEAGYPLVPNLFAAFRSLVAFAARGSLFAARLLTSQCNLANGIGLANTSLVLFGNRLFALGESDLPYIVKLTSNGDIQTLGRHDFDGKLSMSMTAHPKIDPETGEVFAFRYFFAPPFLTYFRFDSNGRKQPDVPILSMTRPTFLHDFAITKKYAIFADIQLEMNPIKMILGGTPVGSDPNKVPRIGVLPRYATDESEIKWFFAPGFNVLHAVNAWDEDDGNAITLIAVNALSMEHTLENFELAHVVVEKVRIDLKTGLVTRQPISTRNLDFGVINQTFIGRENKYVYAAIGDPMPKCSGVVKMDLSKGDKQKDWTVASRMYGEGCYGGEPFFVAKEPENPEAEEDDGYVVTYVHDEINDVSKFLVMDAKSPELEVVATVKLPQRVPYGFHGMFARESDLRELI